MVGCARGNLEDPERLGQTGGALTSIITRADLLQARRRTQVQAVQGRLGIPAVVCGVASLARLFPGRAWCPQGAGFARPAGTCRAR